MLKYKASVILVVLAFSTVALTARAKFDNQAPDRSDAANREQMEKEKKKRRLDFESQLPVVSYDAQDPELSDPNKRAGRLTKSKAYNDKRGVKPVLSEIETGVLNNEWEWGLASVLPSAQSAAVFVGEVTDARGYLSEDKTNVYSEFTVRVEEVLKNDGAEPISAGASVVTERTGGRVRFSSGRVASIYVSGQSMPRVGHRYVFFLGFNPYEANTKSLTGPRGDMRRHILTAYELRAGRVFPLDHAGGKNFQDHKGKDETAFLDELRRSIANLPQTSPE